MSVELAKEEIMATSSQKPYRRRQFVVDPRFQYRVVAILLLIFLVLLGGAFGSVYLALWITLRTFGVVQEPFATSLLTSTGLFLVFELILISPVVVWAGIRLSHRVAGPLVRITSALQRMSKGDFGVHLKLRKGDALVELANSINTLVDSLRSHNG